MVDATLPTSRWTDWPVRRQPVRSAVATLVIGLAALSVALVDGWLALLTIAVLVWATADVLLPVSYSLDDDGITVVRATVRRHHPWSRFEGWRAHPEGFVLQGRGHRRALRAGRTLLVRCGDERTAVATTLSTWLPGPA
ncbi:MAG: hypothetical protein AAF602_33005 [Myxococcota bacterium]